MDLPIKYKAFWLFICDRCDCAGVWEPNMRLAITQIGEPIELVEVLRVFEKRIEQTPDGKLWIRGFIKFQYGIELNPSNTAHLGVLRRLEKSKIKPPVHVALDKGLRRGLKAPQDKDKDKDKDKKGSAEGKQPKPPRYPNGITDSEWIETLCHDATYAGIDVKREHGKMLNWCKTHGSTPTRRRFVNWLNRAEKPMTGTAQGTYPKGWSQKQIDEFEEAQKKYG